ncbi:MAG: hypothetical protein ACM3QR_00255 [Syntrophothermus sp.]
MTVTTEDFKEEKEPDNGCIDMGVFLDSIKKIEKIRGITDGTEATWRFELEMCDRKETIAIGNNKLMMGPSEFNNLFKSRFGFFLPSTLGGRNKESRLNWIKFQVYIEQNCIEVDPIESTEWSECDLILDVIAKLPVLTEGLKWADKTRAKKTLMKKEQETQTFYILKAGDVPTIVKEQGLLTKTTDIAKVMNRRGFKREKNPACRIDKRTVVNPAWWFTEEILKEHGLQEWEVEAESNEEPKTHNNDLEKLDTEYSDDISRCNSKKRKVRVEKQCAEAKSVRQENKDKKEAEKQKKLAETRESHKATRDEDQIKELCKKDKEKHKEIRDKKEVKAREKLDEMRKIYEIELKEQNFQDYPIHENRGY